MSIAIIGAGPSGLVTAKEALECGLNPVVFESANTIGGVWRPDGGSTWDSMKLNNSHFSSTFSDFPWEKGCADFPTHSDQFEYLNKYASHFRVVDKVELNTKVTKVERVREKWQVEWIKEGNLASRAFDYIAVCSGFFSKPYIPKIPGLDTFTGEVFHSKNYKNPDPFRGKNVVVIGNSFSGCEIAAEISTVAVIAHHLFGTARWIQSRYLQLGGKRYPFDLAYRRHTSPNKGKMTPSDSNKAANAFMRKRCQLQTTLDPTLEISSPDTDPMRMTISDIYLRQVQKGVVLLGKGKTIDRIDRGVIHFKDGSTLAKVDSIVFCTGYRTELPFFSTEIQEEIDFKQEQPLLPLPTYKSVFHPKLPNLAFIGLLRVGMYFGVIELQARWACNALAGRVSLPTEETMTQGVKEATEVRQLEPKPQHSQGCFGLCDMLAKEIEALPDFSASREASSAHCDQILNGPRSVAVYRLQGLGSKPDIAKQQLAEIAARVSEPLEDAVCDYPGLDG